MAYRMNSIKVLIIEDNWHMRALAKSLLSAFGVEQIDAVADAEAGYALFVQNKHDLIIVDWMLDPMDGIEFTRLVRGDKQSPNPFVPIIMMTGYSEKKRVIEARDAGVTEFLVKPFTSRSLFARIEQIIERPRQFVRAPEYFGPDRRRLRNGPYDGSERRKARRK